VCGERGFWKIGLFFIKLLVFSLAEIRLFYGSYSYLIIILIPSLSLSLNLSLSLMS
jgi:hypothetical protein